MPVKSLHYDSDVSVIREQSLHCDVSDLLHLRRNRRVSVYPLSLTDFYHSDIQKILESDKCEEVKFQMVRPSTDMKQWAGQVLRFYV